MTTARWTHQEPFTLLNRILDDYVRRSGSRTDSTEEEVVQSTWTPAVDVKENDDALTLFVELPGIPKDKIGISLENHVLTVHGERAFHEGEDRDQFHRVERYYGKFNRSFRLPRDVDGGKVAARYVDGVLRLDIPKAEAAKPRQITIS